MAENTLIEWATHTFNPWTGCTKVSPACDNCYAESWAKRAGRPELWQGERKRTTERYWRQPLEWDAAAEAAGRRDQVFCASLADVFDNQVPDAWRKALWALIERTPNLDWLLLTKRPQNIAKMLPDPLICARPWGAGWPNVWLGTTVENQDEAERRIPHLLAVPAALRFLSCEPLLGQVNLHWIALPGTNGFDALRGETEELETGRLIETGPRLDWVICGGESGPKARPMHPDWARSLRDQCAAAGVPFFFKQWGQWRPGGRTQSGWYYFPSATGQDGEGSIFTPNNPDHDWGDGHVALRAGKKVAGRLLDGVQHDGMPTIR